MQSGGCRAQNTVRATFGLSSILGYWNEKIFAILNPHVAPMPPTNFQLNLTYRLGADVV